MRALFIALTVLEAGVFLAVVVAYLVRTARSLQAISRLLGKVAFGVRAIESQTAPIGPTITRLNQQWDVVVETFAGLNRQVGDGGRTRSG
ncbi:MAG: hypothetical protein M3133_09285 [Actinomycetota bacterium]|nr:hypothetical protein [Actinomycetota bacterium]